MPGRHFVLPSSGFAASTPQCAVALGCGDGATSSDQDLTHTYIKTGVYTVSLTVTGPAGSDTETKTDLIVVEERSQEAIPWIQLLLLND